MNKEIYKIDSEILFIYSIIIKFLQDYSEYKQKIKTQETQFFLFQFQVAAVESSIRFAKRNNNNL